jgi:hypothetical protein
MRLPICLTVTLPLLCAAETLSTIDVRSTCSHVHGATPPDVCWRASRSEVACTPICKAHSSLFWQSVCVHCILQARKDAQDAACAEQKKKEDDARQQREAAAAKQKQEQEARAAQQKKEQDERAKADAEAKVCC